MFPSFISQLPSYKIIDIPSAIYENIIQSTSYILDLGEIHIELYAPINSEYQLNNISFPSKSWLEKRISDNFFKKPIGILSFDDLSSTLNKHIGTTESKKVRPYSMIVAPAEYGRNTEGIFILVTKTNSINIDKKQIKKIKSIISLVTNLLSNSIIGHSFKRETKLPNVETSKLSSELLFYHSPIPKYLLDLDNYFILKANKKMLNHFGKEESSIVGKKVSEILKKEEVLFFMNSLQASINATTHVNFGVFTHITSNGKSTRFELIGNYLNLEDTKTILFACYDVTEKENKLLQVQSSERRLKIAATINKIGYWSIDPNKNTITLTKEVNRIWCRPKEFAFVSYSSFLKTIHPHDQYLFPPPNSPLINKKQGDVVFRIILPDNTIKWIRRLDLNLSFDGFNTQVLEGFFQDISKEKRGLDQKELRVIISNIFNQEKQLPNCLNKILKHVVEFGGYTFGEVWLPNLDYGHLTLTAKYSSNKTGSTFYQESNHFLSVPHGQGLPGSVFQKQNIEEWDPTDNKFDFKRRKAARKTGIHKTIGIPLMHHKEIVGVLLLGASEHHKIPASDRRFLKTLESHIGSELQRKINELELSQIFNCFPDLLITINTQGYIKKINPASENLIGYSEQELLEKSILEIVHPDDRNDLIKNIHLIQTEQTNFKDDFGNGQFPIHEIVNRYITIDGKMKWLKWRFTGALQKGLILGIGKDISHEVNLNKQLEMVNSLAQIGSWEMNPTSKQINWCPITRKIYQVGDDFNPTIENYKLFTKHESDFQKLMKLLEKCINNEIQNFDHQLPIITSNDKECWIRVVGRGEYINNSCIGVYGKTQNINEFKKIELAYRKAYKDKNRILNSIRDAFISVDKDWNIKYWNRSAELLMRTSREEALKTKLWEVFPNLKKRFDRKLISVGYIESLQDNYFEIFNNKIEKWLEVSAYPAPSGMSFYIKDISKRITASKKMEAANERFEKATQAASDIIYERCLRTNNLFLSKAFNTILGHTVKPVSENLEFWLEHIHKDDKSLVLKEQNKAFRNSNIKKWKGEYRFLKSNNKFANVQDTCLIIRDELGKPTRVIGAITDITKQKRHAKSLLDLNNKLMIYSKKVEIQNQQLRDIAWTQSHIVRAPVARILALVDLVKGDLLDENEKNLMLKQIEYSTMELDDIIKEIVSKTKPIFPVKRDQYG